MEVGLRIVELVLAALREGKRAVHEWLED